MMLIVKYGEYMSDGDDDFHVDVMGDVMGHAIRIVVLQTLRSIRGLGLRYFAAKDVRWNLGGSRDQDMDSSQAISQVTGDMIRNPTSMLKS